MYYYDNKFNDSLDAEDLILDYLMYRKTNSGPRKYRIKDQYEIGRGWPHYKDMLPHTGMEADNEDISASRFEYVPSRPSQHDSYKNYVPSGPPRHGHDDYKNYVPSEPPRHGHDDYKNYVPSGPPSHDFGRDKKGQPYRFDHYDEHDALKGLYCEQCAKLLPYINEVLSKYDYEGSPIYAPSVSKRVLDEIIDNIMRRASSNDRALIEALLLPEVFHVKRRRRRGM